MSRNWHYTRTSIHALGTHSRFDCNIKITLMWNFPYSPIFWRGRWQMGWGLGEYELGFSFKDFVVTVAISVLTELKTMVLSVSDHSPVAPLSVSLITHRHHLWPCLRHCIHSQCLSGLSEWVITHLLALSQDAFWNVWIGSTRWAACVSSYTRVIR